MGASEPHVNVQIDPDFRFTRAESKFLRTCVGWAEKLNQATEGGVSLKLWSPPTMIFPTASIWWNGKEVVRLFLEHGAIKKLIDGNHPALNPVVTDQNFLRMVYHEFEKNSLREMERLSRIKNRLYVVMQT
jgi:hypothetical protein